MSTLNGIKVLVTRPSHQSEHLCKLITEKSGQPVRLPVIDIVEIDDNSALLTCLTHLDEFNLAIFISANAVEKTLPTLLAQRNLPPQLQLISIGKRTTDTLKAWGLTALCPASPFNSEAVLEMPQLDKTKIRGKKIVIFRGEGGRELLAETLRQRGAIVDYVNVYRRVQPPTPAWLANTKVDIITVTSNEGLQNLFAMFSGQPWRKNTPLVVMSERIRGAALKLGVQAPVLVANTASDEGLLAAVIQIAIQSH